MRARAVVLAVPLALLLGMLAGLLSRGVVAAAAEIVRPTTLTIGIVLVALAGLAHLVAVVDAWRLSWRRAAVGESREAPGPGARTGPRARAGLAVMLALLLSVYGGLDALGLQAAGTLDRIFGGGGGYIPEPSFEPTPAPTPSPSPATPGPTARATPPPTPTSTAPPAWAANGRLDVLLIGSDAGPGRWSLRTDTMIVLSVDVVTARGALIGIPRNLVNVPLPPESASAFRDGRFPDLLNALYRYAMDHPDDFPGGEARGFRALSGAIQELLRARLDGLVVIDLNAFVDLVDALGGIWIDVPEWIVDERYPLETGRVVRMVLSPGCQLLDGRHALFFARSRHGSSDYDRMDRQQQALRAVRRQLDPVALLPRVPELLEVAADGLWTTLERDDLAELAALAARVDATAVRSILLQPPDIPEYLDDEGLERVRDLARWALAGPRPTPAPPTPSTVPSASTGPCG